LLHKIEPTAKAVKLCWQNAGQSQPMDEGQNQTTNLGVAQNATASSHYVRPERSPLHDVRQHAQALTPVVGAFADADLFYGWALSSFSDFFRSIAQIFATDWPTGSPLVEPDGIEPTTSCLQSRRSPNWAMAPQCGTPAKAGNGGPGKIWTSDLTLIKRAL
jgi:hypothetical protein